MTENKTTIDVTMEDIQNAEKSVSLRRPGNNEKITLYPHIDDTEHGIIRHDYDGYPAMGTVVYDITDWEIVGYDLNDPTDDEDVEFDMYKDTIKEWIQKAVFTGRRTRDTCVKADYNYEGDRKITVENPYDGDTFTIKLEVANKRRLR